MLMMNKKMIWPILALFLFVLLMICLWSPETTTTNTPPIANDDTATCFDGDTVSILVLDNDVDTDLDPESIVIDNTGSEAFEITAKDGYIKYDARIYELESGESETDSFTYTVKDMDGQISNSATVEVTIIPDTNTPPEANDDTYDIIEGDNTPLDVLDNDGDYDRDPITVISVTQGSKGDITIIESGERVSYYPDAETTGLDSFTYTISDGNGGTDTATVYIDIVTG